MRAIDRSDTRGRLFGRFEAPLLRSSSSADDSSSSFVLPFYSRVGIVLVLLVLSCHVKKRKVLEISIQIYTIFSRSVHFFFTSLHFTSKETGRVERKDDDDDYEKRKESTSMRRRRRRDEIIAQKARRLFLQHILGGKRNLKRMTKRAAKHIERRKWMGTWMKSWLDRKTPNESDVLTILMIAFAVAMALLALVLRRAIAKIFKNRNVSRDEEEQKDHQKRLRALGDDEGRRG